MRTCELWWSEIRIDYRKMQVWLQRECYAKQQGSRKMLNLARKYNIQVLNDIAIQESVHYDCIKQYMFLYGIPLISAYQTRYWEKVHMKFTNLEQIGDLAGKMRHERLRMIANDSHFLHLSQLFKSILRDEEAYIEIFKKLDIPQEEIAMLGYELGIISLGLIA